MWWPSNVDSLITSRHHTNIDVNNKVKPLISKKLPLTKACIYKTPPIAHEKAEKAEKNGHGLGSTKWKGCRCKVLDTVYNKVILDCLFFDRIKFF